jgi:hydroxymethylpyrimidine kinase/phosphomethylpyrimidine kinase/thiamine-phosphate diphosphorylase
MTTCALTIAGSDPGGGAGIQADLRVFDHMGLAGLSAATAITSQNSMGVKEVHRVPPDMLISQLDAVFEDASPAAVKIGMLGGAEQARATADSLRRHSPPNVVLDTVLSSTAGVPLLDQAGWDVLVREIFPHCNLITPNIDEARLLTGMAAGDSLDAIEGLGRRLIEMGAKSVLIKGGHRTGEPIDVLICPGAAPAEFRRHRIDTRHSHGTGCFLSAAIAGCLAHGLCLREAVRVAGDMLHAGLSAPVTVGRGSGYPGSLFAEGILHSALQSRLSAELSGIYVVTDSDLFPGRGHVEIARAALAGGARIIQLRDKRTPTPELVDVALEIRALTSQAQALFFVNDRVDIAVAASADGVHLGQSDMPPAAARRVLKPWQTIGLSVATVEEAVKAAPWASYLGVGAVYETRTKADAGRPVGPALISAVKSAVCDLPIVAIGGINESNIGDVTEAGADAAAVISAVIAAPNMQDAVRSLIALRDSALKHAETAVPR